MQTSRHSPFIFPLWNLLLDLEFQPNPTGGGGEVLSVHMGLDPGGLLVLLFVNQILGPKSITF